MSNYFVTVIFATEIIHSFSWVIWGFGVLRWFVSRFEYLYTGYW